MQIRTAANARMNRKWKKTMDDSRK